MKKKNTKDALLFCIRLYFSLKLQDIDCSGSANNVGSTWEKHQIDIAAFQLSHPVQNYNIEIINALIYTLMSEISKIGTQLSHPYAKVSPIDKNGV